MAKAGPKSRRQPFTRSAPSSAHTQMGMATNNAGSRKKGGTDRPATAPAASKSRKRRQPWLSMAVSASQVMEAAKANQWTWGQGGRALPGRQGNGFGGGLANGSALGIQRNA